MTEVDRPGVKTRASRKGDQIRRPRDEVTSSPATGVVAGVLHLQRLAGNRAVASLLGQHTRNRESGVVQRGEATGPPVKKPAPLQPKAPTGPTPVATGPAVVDRLGPGRAPVQRLKTKFDDFNKLTGTLSRITGSGSNLEEASFAAIRDELKSYQRDITKYADDPKKLVQNQLDHLQQLQKWCTDYLERGKKAKETSQQTSRRLLVEKLHNEIAGELASLSQQESMKRYQDSILQSGVDQVDSPIVENPTTKSKNFGFRALSADAKEGATNYRLGDRSNRKDAIEALSKKYGLDAAEISAITTFSAGDYKYINPVTANSQEWLDSQKEKADKKDDRFQNVDNATIREEGSLHTAVAVRGLKRLPRFRGESYRGARFTPERFVQEIQLGKKAQFKSLSSSSYDKDVALRFVHGLSSSKPKKEESIAVISVFTDAGVDISDIALAKKEAEVLILPGSWFILESLEEVDGNARYQEYIDQAKGQPIPTKWYVARYTATTSESTAKRPRVTEPWMKSSAPKGSNLPITASIDDYLKARGKTFHGAIGAAAKREGDHDEGTL